MKILVSGARGFIGSHLVEELLAHQHSVRALDLRGSSELDPGKRELEHVSGDVTNPDDCAAAVADCQAVCHLAAKVGDWGPSKDYERVNVEGTRLLMEAAKRAGVRRFVLVSSLAVHHYRGFYRADERAPRDGHINAYARSKIDAERVVEAGWGDMETAIVRPGVFPFGPRDLTAFFHLARQIELGRFGYLNGGRAMLCTAYVENLVHGLRLALEHPAAAGETFVIADECAISWRELFERFAAELQVTPPRCSVPELLAYPVAACWEGLYRLLGVERAPLLTRYRVLLVARDCHFVSDKARELLGYRARIGLDEAIRRTVAWYSSIKSPSDSVS